MAWSVEYTDEFGVWWKKLSEAQQEDIDAHVRELERRGPMLPFPYSSDVKGSAHGAMRELRIQSAGRPIRILRLRSEKNGDIAYWRHEKQSAAVL